MKSLTDYYKNYLESITYFSYTDLISDYISEIKEDLLIYSNDFFKELNYNKWINETYEDAVIDNSELTEDEFYNHKYTLIEKYGMGYRVI